MKNETQKVDVLAVMNRWRDQHSIGSDTCHVGLEQIEEVAAAVSELIKAIEDDATGYAVVAEMGVSEWTSFVPHRTFAALVRVGGAA